MISNNGIRGYKVTKLETKAKGLLKCKIRIVPIEAVEDFDIVLELADPSRAGVVVPVEQNEDEDLLMLLMPMMLND